MRAIESLKKPQKDFTFLVYDFYEKGLQLRPIFKNDLKYCFQGRRRKKLSEFTKDARIMLWLFQA